MKWHCFSCQKEFNEPLVVDLTGAEQIYLYRCPFCKSTDIDKFNENEISDSDYCSLADAINAFDSTFDEEEDENQTEDEPCPSCSQCSNPNNDDFVGLEWNLQLSKEDKEEHQFMLHTLDPLVKKLLVTEDYYRDMFNRFVKTFN